MTIHSTPITSDARELGARIAAVLYSERAAALARRALHEGAGVVEPLVCACGCSFPADAAGYWAITYHADRCIPAVRDTLRGYDAGELDEVARALVIRACADRTELGRFVSWQMAHERAQGDRLRAAGQLPAEPIGPTAVRMNMNAGEL